MNIYSLFFLRSQKYLYYHLWIVNDTRGEGEGIDKVKEIIV